MLLLEELLDRAQVEIRTTNREHEVMLCCPFCSANNFSEDTGYHLGLNVSKGLAHCFRCGWKSRTLIHTLRQLSRAFRTPVQLRYVRTVKKEDVYDKRTKELKRKVLGLPTEYEPFGNITKADEVEKRAADYLAFRGISGLQIERHKIGFAAFGDLSWRILFPVFDENRKTVGCVARAIVESVIPKYMNTAGSKSLYGVEQGGTTAVLVEGVIDALKVEQALLSKKTGWVALARLGSSLTSTQLAQLRRYEKVIILPDRDVAGMNGASETATICYEAGLNTWVSVPERMDGTDPGSMSTEKLIQYIKGAEQWQEKMIWRMKANSLRKVV